MLPVIIKVGDITQEDVDAIVNAANPTLMGGGGVDGAIHRAGGPSILAACRKIREKEYPEGLPVGQAVITPAGKLKARWVIHTVGPIYGNNQGRDAELLSACYENCIELASQYALFSIASLPSPPARTAIPRARRLAWRGRPSSARCPGWSP
jgi:O-acetyl-ADP-ribose deacetylase (regulator of RNase III)